MSNPTLLKRFLGLFKRIDTETARLYRYSLVSGINKARREFGYGKFLKNTRWEGDMGVSGAVTYVKLETMGYIGEKRRHGWRSAPKKNTDDRNGMSTALMVAAVSAF